MTDLTNDVAIVTGGAGGLGQAEVELLALAGAKVLLADRAESQGAAIAEQINNKALEQGGSVTFVPVDLAELEACAEKLESAAAKVGPVSILVNNAATVINKPIADIQMDEFENLQRINAHSAYLLSKTFARQMQQLNRGRIINVVSITLNGEWSDFSPYVISKGSLLAMTRALARELGQHNITVNSVCPGAMEGDAEKSVFGDGWQKYNDYVIERQSLKWRGGAQEIAKAVKFFASEESRFISGQCLNVDGGWWMQ